MGRKHEHTSRRVTSPRLDQLLPVPGRPRHAGDPALDRTTDAGSAAVRGAARGASALLPDGVASVQLSS